MFIEYILIIICDVLNVALDVFNTEVNMIDGNCSDLIEYTILSILLILNRKVKQIINPTKIHIEHQKTSWELL